MSLENVAGMIIALILMNYTSKADTLFKKIFKFGGKDSLLDHTEGAMESAKQSAQNVKGLVMGAAPMAHMLTNTPYGKAVKGAGKAAVAVGVGAARLAKLPFSAVSQNRYENRVKAEMEKSYNCSVTVKDVAKKMDIEPEKIDTYLSAYTTTVSLEGNFDANNGSELAVADVIADERATVEENIEFEELKREITNVVSTLKEREQAVIKMRFGLEDCVKTTLEDIGKLYGVTKECIRQTEMRALKKLRHNLAY